MGNINTKQQNKKLRRIVDVPPANLKEPSRDASDPEMQARPTDRGRLACTFPQGKQKGG
jgi:hypothetical protein